MIFRSIYLGVILFALPLVVVVCSPQGDEPDQVFLEVREGATGIEPVVSDAGWSVELTSARIAVRNLEMTIEGEEHTQLLEKAASFILPSAMAHPGHMAGGDVTGELRGDFILNPFASDALPLGEATLLEGAYHGFNFTFRNTDAQDGLDPSEPLLDHAAQLKGFASKGETKIEFEALIQLEDTQMIGGVFECDLHAGSAGTLVLELNTFDAYDEDTLFDGLDFGALDTDGDLFVTISPGSPEHNVLKKTLVKHDYWQMRYEEVSQ